MSAEQAEALIGRLGFNTASLPDRPVGEAAAVGRSLGLAGIELLAFEGYRHRVGELAGCWLDRMTRTKREALEAAVDPFEHVSVHAPFWDIAPLSPNPAVAGPSRRQLHATIAQSARIGASTVTTHVIPRAGRRLEEYREDLVELYRGLGDTAGEAGVTVTIETGFPLEIDEFAGLLAEIDHPAVGANVDVGHLRGLMSTDQRQAPDAPERYNDLLAAHVRSVGPRLMHMHLHDVRRSDFRDHTQCGTGIIEFRALFELLMELDYGGLLNFELEEPDDEAALRASHEHVVARARAAAGV